jgi:MFS family permease
VSDAVHRPSLRCLWFSRVGGMMSYQMIGVAVGWQIYDITRSTLDLGLVGLAQFFPLVLFLLPVGHFVDRYDRRVMAATSEAIGALAAAGLALMTLSGSASIALIYVCVFLVGTSRALELPSTSALLPNLVPIAELGRATANFTTATKTATIIGPVAGGLLYAAGPGIVYVLAAVVYFTAGVLIAFIRLERVARRGEPPTLRSVLAGIDFILKTPIVLGPISLDLFAVLLGGATALLPVFARDILVVGPWGLGLLRSGPAIGALTTSFVLGRRPMRRHVGWIMFACVGAFGAATMIFGISRSFVLSLVALIVLGAADVTSVVIRSTLVQGRTPDRLRGRVGAVNSMFTGTANQLGEFESGLTASWWGTVPAVVLGGIGTIVIALLWMRLFPTLARIDSLDVHAEAVEATTTSRRAAGRRPG